VCTNLGAYTLTVLAPLAMSFADQWVIFLRNAILIHLLTTH
jgi:hypothetical protein